jgi:hypothetical protein
MLINLINQNWIKLALLATWFKMWQKTSKLNWTEALSKLTPRQRKKVQEQTSSPILIISRVRRICSMDRSSQANQTLRVKNKSQTSTKVLLLQEKTVSTPSIRKGNG